jgi:replicative DNA helicase
VHYAEIVRDAARKRWLIQVAEGLAKDAFSGEVDPEEAIANVQSNLARSEDAERDVYAASELVDAFLKTATERKENPDSFGLETGIVPLDNALGGGLAAGLYILAARPSMGKTSVALQAVSNVAKRQERALFFTLEMSRDQLVERIVTSEAGVSLFEFNAGEISDEEFYTLHNVAAEVYEWPLLVCDRSKITPGGIRTRIQSAQRAGDLELVVIDYLNLVTPSESRETRTRELGDICRECLQISQDFDLPVLLLHQLNRGVENRSDKRPVMSDLRGSGEISEAADVIMMLYREAYYDSDDESGEMEILIRKNRLGGPANDKCCVYWHGETMRCKPLARGQEAPPEVDF